MRPTEKLMKFVRDYRSLIAEDNFEELYEEAAIVASYSDFTVGNLTEMLYEAGIDPLKFLDRIPSRFLPSESEYPVDGDLIIPSNVKIVGKGAFFGCSQIWKVVIQEGVTTLEEMCFHDCGNLRELQLPASIKKIQFRALHGTNLSSIHYTGTSEQWRKIKWGSFTKSDLDGKRIHTADGVIRYNAITQGWEDWEDET